MFYVPALNMSQVVGRAREEFMAEAVRTVGNTTNLRAGTRMESRMLWTVNHSFHLYKYISIIPHHVTSTPFQLPSKIAFRPLPTNNIDHPVDPKMDLYILGSCNCEMLPKRHEKYCIQ